MKNTRKWLIIAIVCAVVLLAAAVVAVTVVLPAMNDARREGALQKAQDVYAQYRNGQDADPNELAVWCQGDLYVAIRGGTVLDIFESADESAKALLDNPKSTDDESVGYRMIAAEGYENLFLLYPALPSAPTAETEGAVFTTEDVCTANRGFDALPTTFEAWVKLPTSLEGSAGVIASNYAENVFPCFSFNVGVNGMPSLYLAYEKGKFTTLTFENIDLRTDEWVHVAITNDFENGTAFCFVDGVLKGVEDAREPIEKSGPVRFGGDNRTSNLRIFRGALHSVAFYSDARGLGEIKNDMQSYGEENLIAAWNFSCANEDHSFTDLSGNGYQVTWPQVWFEESAFDADYDYTFVAIGDTQLTNVLDYRSFQPIFDWIVNNKEEQKIAYVVGLGDITDVDRDAEWTRAEAGYGALFNADIPCSILRGNHDSAEKFNRTFFKDPYLGTLDGTYGDGVINTYRKITVHGVKYLFITMDFGARDDVLAWADEVISENPDYNVIVATHAYLYPDGTPIQLGDSFAPTNSDPLNNNGEDMWERLIKKHENIVLVLCGHECDRRIITAQDKGENGNVVTQILSDHSGVDSNLIYAEQKAAGMLTLLHFSEDGTKMTVECYSPIYDKYYLAENQFELTIDSRQ